MRSLSALVGVIPNQEARWTSEIVDLERNPKSAAAEP